MATATAIQRQDGSESGYKYFFERYPHFLEEYSLKDGWRIVRETTAVDAKLPRLAEALRHKVVNTDPKFVAFVLAKAKLLNSAGEEVTSGSSLVPIEYHDEPVFGNWTGVVAPMVRGAGTASLQRLIAAAGFRGDENKQDDEYKDVDARGVVRERWAIVRRWPYFLKAYPLKSGWRLIHECFDLDAVFPREAETLVKRQREHAASLIGYVLFKATLFNPQGKEAQSGTVLWPINTNKDYEKGETIATHALFTALNLPGDTQYLEDEVELMKLDGITVVPGPVKTATVTPIKPEKPRPVAAEPVATATTPPAAPVAAAPQAPAAPATQAATVEDGGIKNPYTNPKQAKPFQHLTNQVLMMCKQRKLEIPKMSTIEEARAAYKELTKPKAKEPEAPVTKE